MEWIFYIGVILCLIDIEQKLQNLSKEKKRSNRLPLKDYIGKKVSLVISNDDINNSYQFSSIQNMEGNITDFDDEWLEFTYMNKNKEYVQYFRIKDVESIDEIIKR